MLSEYMPPGFVINGDLEIVQFLGQTGRYLDPMPGPASFQILKMARQGLPFELRKIILQAQHQGTRLVKEGIAVKANGGTREIDLEVRLIKGPSGRETYFLVLLHERPQQPAPASVSPSPEQGAEEAAQEMRRELDETRTQLEDVIDQLATNNNELLTANEEVQSSNEELQSSNEELETAKEELQATNEELTTLNDELQNRNQLLTLTNNDLNNVISNVTVPMVILGSDLRIRRFTPNAQEVLNLIPADVGRPITDLRSALDFPGLEGLVREAIDTSNLKEREVKDARGRWYSLRVRPYRTAKDHTEGAILTLVDIDKLKAESAGLREYAGAVAETVRECLLVLDEELRVKATNRLFLEMFRLPPEETKERLLPDLDNGQWNIPDLIRALREVLPKQQEIRDFEVEHEFAGLGRRTMLLSAREIRQGHGPSHLIVLVIDDITESKQAREKLEEQARLLDLANDAIVVRTLDGVIKFWNRGAENVYGWGAEEAFGKTLPALLKTEWPEPVEQLQAKLLDHGEWEGEVVQTRRDGTRVAMASRQVLQRDSGGHPAAVLEINRDIAARRLAEEAVRLLSARLIQAQDEERRRIAGELHNSTAQSLSALAMNLALIEQRKAIAGDDRSAKALGESQELVEQAAREIRDLSHLLHASGLDSTSLIRAIRSEVARFNRRTGILVDFNPPSDMGLIDADVITALTRVVQEGLSNIQRHAESPSAVVRIARGDEELVLEVEDKGKGMPPGIPEMADREILRLGVGIAGLRERLRQLGGRLELLSGPKGTTVRAIVSPSSRRSVTAGS